MAVLRHLRDALPIQINFADAFDAREHVIHGLAAEANEFRANDSRNKIARHIENLLRRGAIESLTENRGHGAGKRLHFWAKRHANVCSAVFIHVQVNADRIRTFLIFAHIDKIKILVFARLPFLRVAGIRHERLASLIFRQRFKQIDDLV